IADGALEQIGNVLQRQAELSEQSANGVLTSTQRSALQSEFVAGAIPRSGHAAVRLGCFFADVCDESSSSSSSAFNSAKHAGGIQRHSVRRSFAIAPRACSRISSQRPDTTAALSWNTASALSSVQEMPLPFSRRSSTRRIALSIAPLPSGTPRRRKL